MYGLVNRAVEGLLRQRCGDDGWLRIKQRAGVEEDVFVRMETYPDAITCDLVAAASDELNLPAETLLREFGRYWMQYTAVEGYGSLLDACGDSLETFLANLDTLHARVGFSYPGLKPPSFRCEPMGEGELALHYYSVRPGLAPFVVGLLQGLARRFQLTAEIEQQAAREQGADHDVFVVRYRPAVG